jgi:hypothetical protein
VARLREQVQNKDAFAAVVGVYDQAAALYKDLDGRESTEAVRAEGLPR